MVEALFVATWNNTIETTFCFNDLGFLGILADKCELLSYDQPIVLALRFCYFQDKVLIFY